MSRRGPRIMSAASAGIVIAAGAAFTTTTTAHSAQIQQASCASSAEDSWFVPSGHTLPFTDAGIIYWHDTNEDSGNDQDNFKIVDHPGDGMSSSIWVRNNYTGKSYYKHVYSGDSYCLGVGNIPRGKSASWQVCAWDNGDKGPCLEGRTWE